MRWHTDTSDTQKALTKYIAHLCFAERSHFGVARLPHEIDEAIAEFVVSIKGYVANFMLKQLSKQIVKI